MGGNFDQSNSIINKRWTLPKSVDGRKSIGGVDRPKSNDFNVTKGNWYFAVDHTISISTYIRTHIHRYTMTTKGSRASVFLKWSSNEHQTHARTVAHTFMHASTHTHLRSSLQDVWNVLAISRSVGSPLIFNEIVFVVVSFASMWVWVCVSACICVILATQSIICSRVYDTTTYI